MAEIGIYLCFICDWCPSILGTKILALCNKSTRNFRNRIRVSISFFTERITGSGCW